MRIFYPFLYNLVFSIFVQSSSCFPLPSGNQPNIPPKVSSVLIPPIIKYWSLPSAFGQHNVTLKDDFGRKWSCTTYRQSHCVPLFKVSTDFKAASLSISKPDNSKDQPTTTSTPLQTSSSRNEIYQQKSHVSGNTESP